MLQAAKLDKRITLQAPTVERDASGGMTKGWADVCTVWAGVRNMSGNERRATSHGGEVAEMRAEFTLRYRAGVDATQRVLYAGRVYNIRHVNDWLERHESITLTCDTGVNDG